MKKTRLDGRDCYSDHPIIDRINEWFAEKHCIKYTKWYRLYIDDDGYELQMALNNPIIPYTISGDFANDDEFLNYLFVQLNKLVHTTKYLLLVDKTYLDLKTCTKTTQG